MHFICVTVANESSQEGFSCNAWHFMSSLTSMKTDANIWKSWIGMEYSIELNIIFQKKCTVKFIYKYKQVDTDKSQLRNTSKCQSIVIFFHIFSLQLILGRVHSLTQ